jgi:ribokinase
VNAAVIGHVEWIEFVGVDHVPEPGEIVHALETWEEPAGGGAVTAVQLAKLAGGATFFTALGDDEVGRRAHERLCELGLTMEVAWRPQPQRRASVFVDSRGERTITVIGDRMGPLAADTLAWDRLSDADCVYFTAGDAGAVRRARSARTLVATARAMNALTPAGIELDVLVASAEDPGERYVPGDIEPPPRVVVKTAGSEGGAWTGPGEDAGRWEATPLPGPVSDAYGCGDSFAGGLAFGLGAGMPVAEAARLGARCGAACFTGRGSYSAQLTAEDVGLTIP